MTKRTKPEPYIVENLEQAEGTMAEIASLERKVVEIEIAMQESIDLAKSKASQVSHALLARHKELAYGLAVFAKLNKQTLFEKAKTLDLAFGCIGFRASTEIQQEKGIKAPTTIEKMREFKFLDGINTSETINRTAMTKWTDSKLETVGLRRVLKDVFFIETKADELPKNAA